MEKKMKKKAISNTNYKQQQEMAPLKIVYISTPLKLETSPSNFRSLVQELTGQDAVWPPADVSKFSSSSSSPRYNNLIHNQTLPKSSSAAKDDDSHNVAAGIIMDSTPNPIQPLDDDDDDDRVVLIERRWLNTFLDDHYDHSQSVQDSRNN